MCLRAYVLECNMLRYLNMVASLIQILKLHAYLWYPWDTHLRPSKVVSDSTVIVSGLGVVIWVVPAVPYYFNNTFYLWSEPASKLYSGIHTVAMPLLMTRFKGQRQPGFCDVEDSYYL